jgi:ArsR family transcriptional regulator
MKALTQTVDEARAVRILRALANPVRFRIVQILAARDACVCGDLVDELPLAQSTVSEHLKVLKEAGVVRGVIEGPNRCYCLDPEALRFLTHTLAALAGQACR